MSSPKVINNPNKQGNGLLSILSASAESTVMQKQQNSFFTPWQESKLLVGTLNSASLPTSSVAPSSSMTTTVDQSVLKPIESKTNDEGANQLSQMHRLKVEDALTYLDQVKIRFENQPQVYNEFLDVMKEFKSQSIDTPGVIGRVSQLFRGNSDLILGFNQFLPPGYRIELSQNDKVNVVSDHHTPPSTSSEQLTLPAVSSPPVSAAMAVSPTTPQPTTASITPKLTSPSQYSTSQTGQLEAQLLSPSPGGIGSQPVEFNHAISYVNKIKNRFQDQPDIYKRFLEILHTYQKEQRHLKEGSFPPGQQPLSESEVYSRVARLFKNQEDLLSEFGQFLPDAAESNKQPGFDRFVLKGSTVNTATPKRASPVRRPNPRPVPTSQPSKKFRPNALPDVSFSEIAKAGTFQDIAFFDQIKRALKFPEVYHNFLRCLHLFIHSVVSRTELVQMVKPFFARHPKLFKMFREYLGFYDDSQTSEHMTSKLYNRDKPKFEIAMEIDFASCRKYGASYRMLPKSYAGKTCSGRTPLCNEVLNDTWVSFPTWTEEMPSFTCKKTQFEETIFRTEDERFELDIVLETNLSTIKVLEVIQRKLSRMSSEEAAKFRLDNTLGGNSDTIHRKAIERVYGDKAVDIIDGLKRSPVVAVPLVLKRLKAKQEEWRLAQKDFNKVWRDTYDKYYLKSLDHQGMNFKQNDSKILRHRALVNELEVAYDERQDSKDDAEAPPLEGPLISKRFPDKDSFPDAYDLLIYHAKRQSNAHKEDKRKIKHLIRRTLPDMLYMPQGEMSEDERDSSSSNTESESDSETMLTRRSRRNRKRNKKRQRERNEESHDVNSEEKANDVEDMDKGKAGIIERFLHGQEGSQSPNTSEDTSSFASDGSDEQAERYTLFFGGNYWYSFFRLLQILCERLSKMKSLCKQAAEDKQTELSLHEHSAALALGLRAPHAVDPSKYYEHFIQMVKDLLDGNMDMLTFEDTVRELFGIQAYVAFTMDKVVQCGVRQLQHLATDDTSQQLLDLYRDSRSRHATGGNLSSRESRAEYEAVYQRKAEQITGDENCVKVLLYGKSLEVTFELLDTETEETESANEARQWSRYIEKFISSTLNITESMKLTMQQKPVFLARNVRGVYPRDEAAKQVCDTPDVTDDNLTDPSHTPFTDPYADHGLSLDHGNFMREDDKCEMNEPNLYQKDEMEVRFQPNQYKMTFSGGSNVHYRFRALPKARENFRDVSLCKFEKFGQWHQKWLSLHVTEGQQEIFDDFLIGEEADDTTKHVITSETQAPFHSFHRYLLSD